MKGIRMARGQAHASCTTCSICGLGWCPDCDDEGKACQGHLELVIDVSDQPDPRHRRAKRRRGMIDAHGLADADAALS